MLPLQAKPRVVGYELTMNRRSTKFEGKWIEKWKKNFIPSVLNVNLKNVRQLNLTIFLAVCVPGTFQNAPRSCAECDEGSYTDMLNTADTCRACSSFKMDTTTEMGGANSSALCGKISQQNHCI